MGGRVADRAGGAVLTTAALHTASLARQTHAHVAVRVCEALHTHARAQIAQAPRALRVGRALDAAAPRQVAHAGRAFIVRQALDADAPQRVTACALPALGVRDTLPTETAELWSASLGRRAAVVRGVARGDTSTADRIADLARRTREGGADRAGRAEAVRRDALTVVAGEA